MGKLKKIQQKIQEGFLQEAVFELKWIFKSVRCYRGYILGYACLNLMIAIIALVFTVKSADLVDCLIEKNWNMVIRLGILYASIGVINVTMSIFRQRMQAIVDARVKRDLTCKTYDSVMRAKWLSISGKHSGDLITRMNEDVAIISHCVVGWIPDILVQGLQILVALICIIYFDITMLPMLCLVAPIIPIGSRLILGKVFQENKRQRKIQSDVTSFEKESFQNIHAIKAFGLEDEFSARMLDLQNLKKTIDIRANKYAVLSWMVMYLSGQAAAIICLVWAVYHVYTGVISFGVMTMMALLATIVASAFKSLIQVIPNAMTTISSATRVRTLLELEAEENDKNELVDRLIEQAGVKGADIRVENIHFAYSQKKEVFRKASFHANAGEIVALVGPSGEGKTTMLRVLLGIVAPDQGKAIIAVHDEEDTNIMIQPAVRRLIAYVPQGNALLNGTIAENMRLMRKDASDEEIIEALKLACAWEFVGRLPFGINHVIGESGIGFSEGQNQRLSIARAFLSNAPILLLDEATSALDVATERRVLNNLMRVGQTRTCILTTPRPTVLSMCNRVYRIATGSIEPIGQEEIEQLMNDF